MMKLTGRNRIGDGCKRATIFLGVLFLAFGWLAISAPSTQAGQNGTAPQKEAKPDLKPFLGTWKGSFGGKVFAILVVKQDERGDISGTLNNFDIGRDKDGNLDDDTHIDVGDGPILNVHLRAGALYFVAIQKDQYAPSTEWKFVPKNASEGELTQMLDGQPYSPNGSIPKPILMLRAHLKP
jgi:hypothetical protein